MNNKNSHGYDGLLIVIEGTDGSGKSTQVNMLSNYVKDKCFGCTVSEWKTSRLISGIINEAKEKNLLNTTTFSLLYAADYTDRLENEIIPVICDNVGTATRIPVVFYSSWLCHRKQKKLFAKFEHQPLIQALRSYEQVR